MCNCCSETEKRDRSELGIPQCIGRTNDAFDSKGCIITRPEDFKRTSVDDQIYGQIFDRFDLLSMTLSSKLMGRAADRSFV